MNRGRVVALIVALAGGGYGVYELTNQDAVSVNEARFYSKITKDGATIAENVSCHEVADARAWLECVTAAPPSPSEPPPSSPPPTPSPAMAQCNDSEDNDRDGKIDLADPGCEDVTDDSESPDPPVPTPTPPTPPPPTPTPPLPTPPALKGPAVGFGAVTLAGETDLPGNPHDVVEVENLNDAGVGSLRQAFLFRSSPRVVKVKIAGTITLETVLRWGPYLTVDCSEAPAPGVTILIEQAAGVNIDPEFKMGATHDLRLQGCRIDGTWDPTKDVKNTATLSVDGDAGAQTFQWDPNPSICWPQDPTYRRRSCRIVIDHNTLSGAADSGTDFWCGVDDVTFSYNLVIDNFHPRSTGCKGVYPEGHHHARNRITEYANVYAYNGERTPKLLEGVYDYDLINGINYAWQNYGTALGKGAAGIGAFWDNDGAIKRHNVIGNFWQPEIGGVQGGICDATPEPKWKNQLCRSLYDCIWDPPLCGADCDTHHAALLNEALHYSGNTFGPDHLPSSCISTPTGKDPLPRPYKYDGTGPGGLTVWPPEKLEEMVLNVAGAPHKNAREAFVVEEVRKALRARLSQPAPSPSSPPPSSPTPTPSSSSPPPSPSLPPPGGGTRYVDPVFSSVKVTTNIVYSLPVKSVVGVTTALTLDLYEPSGDTAMNRVPILVIHGGSMCSGNKGDNGIKELATEYAKRGYVAASINYRLKTICWPDPDPLLGQAVSDAHSDSAAAVRWLRKHAATYRVDPTRVMAAGFSAGATSSFWLAYNTEAYADPTKNTNPSNPGFSSGTAVAVLIGFSSGNSGAKIQPGEATPVVNFYGANDSYYNTYGKPLKQALDAAGIVNEMHVFPGWGHDFLKQNRPTSPPLVATKSGAFILSKVLAP